MSRASAYDGQSTVTWTSNGCREYWHQQQLHRQDGPARIHPDGRQEWWQHGQRHRTDGPATVNPDGSQLWWRHGQLHREDGPAIMYADGQQQYWWYGRPYTLDAYQQLQGMRTPRTSQPLATLLLKPR